MPTSMTFDQIVSHAGKLVGNETLTSFADVWLNNIIDTIAQNHRFPELEKTATGTIGAYNGGGVGVTVAFPSDFADLWDHESLAVIDANGNHTPLQPQTWDWYDMIADPLTTGKPRYAIFNLQNRTWTPYPQPDVAYTWQIRYMIKPSRIVTGTDTIPYASDEIFVQALFVRLLQFEDDARYPAEYQMLQKLIQNYFGGVNTSPIKSPAVRFNSRAFRTPGTFR